MNDQHTASAPAFRGFFQLGYVTRHLERAVDLARDRYGVTEFADLGHVTLALDGGDRAEVRIALTWVGPLQLEIIEPLGGRDEVYRRALPADGSALAWHHIGFRVSTPNALEEARTRLRDSDHEIVLSGGHPEAAMFFYADARATLGHHLEYIYLSPQRQRFHDELPRH